MLLHAREWMHTSLLGKHPPYPLLGCGCIQHWDARRLRLLLILPQLPLRSPISQAAVAAAGTAATATVVTARPCAEELSVVTSEFSLVTSVVTSAEFSLVPSVVPSVVTSVVTSAEFS